MDIEKLLNSEDIDSVRATILAQLDSDRFKSSMEIAGNSDRISGKENIFESHTEVDSYRSSKYDWNRKYWTRTCVELSNNFSKERFKHIVEMMFHLREKKDPRFTPVKKYSSNKKGKHTKTTHNKNGLFDKSPDKISKN